MDEKFFAVEETKEQSVRDDAGQAESTTNSDGAISLSQVLEGGESASSQEAGEAETQEENPEPQEGADKQVEREPAWYRRAIKAEQDKWRQKEAAYKAELAKYAELSLDQEAEKLAASEGVSKNIALRILRAEKGMKPLEAKAEPRLRDDKGRFVGQEVAKEEAGNTDEDPVKARASELMAQNEVLLKASGINALELYRENKKVQEKVNSGEWDFADVVRAYQEETGGRKKTPAPVRAANGGGVPQKTIMGMSSEEFARLNDQLERGAVIDASR